MLATTRGALLRGTTEDALGDEFDNNTTPLIVRDEKGNVIGDWSDFPLSLIERETREQDPASNTWRTVRYFAGRVPADVPVDEGDRIRDNRDGKIYAVDSIRSEPRSLSGRSSVSLKLRRTAP